MSQASSPSYLSAFLTSQANLYAALGAMATGALAAIPYGWVGLGVPMVLFLVGEGLAALVVPDLSTFRSKVDEQVRRDQRSSVRNHLVVELAKRASLNVDGWRLICGRGESVEHRARIKDYNTMIDRIRSLSEVAADRRTQLGEREIERLHEATVDYLALWLARLVLDSREQLVTPSDLKTRIKDIDAKLASATPTAARQLRQARSDYTAILDRRVAMSGKSEAIDAAMLAMPDKIEEIYQMVLAAPFATGIGDKLEDSLSRLRLEEALEQELSADLSASSPDIVLPERPAVVRPAAKTTSRPSVLS